MSGAVRLGLVGVGRWGKNFVRTIASLDDAVLRAVASRNPATAAIIPEGCRIVERWQDLIAANDIDGVIVATPPHTHAPILLEAIAARKPVLVEKPLVSSFEEAETLRNALDRRPATILVDHVHLFHPAFVALQREAKSLGPIRSIQSSAGNHGPYRTDASVLWDWGPHDLAMCLSLVPGIAHALSAQRLARELINNSIAERLLLELSLAGHIHAQIRLSTMDDRHRWFAVFFDRDILVYRDSGDRPLIRYSREADIYNDAGTAISVNPRLPLACAVTEFIQAVRAGSTDRGSVDLGLAVIHLLVDFTSLLATAR